MGTRTIVQARRGAVLLGAIAAAVVGACSSDSSEERLRAKGLAEGCMLNTDCAKGLVCIFTRCHIACRDDSDCVDPLRCMKGDDGAQFCQLQDEVSCDDRNECPLPQVCAVDRECRNECDTAADCVTGQVCVETGQCASPSPGKDVLNSAGNLVPFGVGQAGQQGAGAMGSGGSSGTGSGGTSSASAGSGGANNGGTSSGGTSSAGSSGAASGGASGSGPVGSELEPNDTRDDPDPYTAGDTIAGIAEADPDFFKVTTPAGSDAGGFFEISVEDVGQGTIYVEVISDADRGRIFQHYTNSLGASYYGYFSAAPNESYYLVVTRKAGTVPVAYTLNAAYTEVADTFERNDRQTQAKVLSTGQTHEAYFFTGFRSSNIVLAEYEDWYAVTLNAGAFTVVLDPASSTDARVELYAVGGARIAGALQNMDGAVVEVTGSIVDPGTYYLKAQPYHLPQAQGQLALGGQEPEHLTVPYTIEVSQ